MRVDINILKQLPKGQKEKYVYVSKVSPEYRLLRYLLRVGPLKQSRIRLSNHLACAKRLKQGGYVVIDSNNNVQLSKQGYVWIVSNFYTDEQIESTIRLMVRNFFKRAKVLPDPVPIIVHKLFVYVGHTYINRLTTQILNRALARYCYVPDQEFLMKCKLLGLPVKRSIGDLELRIYQSNVYMFTRNLLAHWHYSGERAVRLDDLSLLIELRLRSNRQCPRCRCYFASSDAFCSRCGITLRTALVEEMKKYIKRNNPSSLFETFFSKALLI